MYTCKQFEAISNYPYKHYTNITLWQNMPERNTSGKLEQSFQTMRDTCRPVFCRYTFLDTQVALITLISLCPCKRVCLCLFGSLPS